MNSRAKGFTLIEIMIAIFVLVVGMVGVLALFPRGLRETKLAIEESNAAIIAQSVYAALRTSVKNMNGNTLRFYHDGMPSNVTYDMSSVTDGNAVGIPAHSTGAAVVLIGSYQLNFQEAGFTQFCQLGQGSVANRAYNFDYTTTPLFSVDDAERLQEYSYNIQISRTAANPDGLYDVAIYIRRGSGALGKLIRIFYTQIAIPL